MPNHCRNLLIIEGPKKDRDAFVKQAQGNNKDDKLALDAFYPMPAELKDTHSGAINIDGKSYRVWRTVDGKNVPVNEDELLKKYGATNWYDWRCQNWGTKWGCYDVELVRGDTCDQYWFSTAWAPFDLMVLEKMSEEFPTLKLTLKFAEQGMDLYGIWSAEDGQACVDVEGNIGGEYHENTEEFIYPDDLPEHIEELAACSG